VSLVPALGRRISALHLCLNALLFSCQYTYDQGTFATQPEMVSRQSSGKSGSRGDSMKRAAGFLDYFRSGLALLPNLDLSKPTDPTELFQLINY